MSDNLVQERNKLVREAESLKLEHELAVNALNISHELEVQSLHAHFGNEIVSQLAAG